MRAQAAIERFCRIDILANNVGQGLIGAVEEATSSQLEAVYRTNVFGLLCRHAGGVGSHAAQRARRNLNFSSVENLRGAAEYGVPPQAPICPSAHCAHVDRRDLMRGTS
jgi:NAD(P)-dependent dehydrogenase (short-subunit alcohol dehydrogenase family)